MSDPQVRAIVRSLTRLAERAIVKITLDVTANLVETTPVDTGWARANWVPAIGRPFEVDLRDVPPTSQNAASARSTQQSAMTSMVGYKLRRGRVFVSNNVPYVPRLNDGSSKKEPAGFVQRAIRKAVTLDIRGLAT